MSCARRCTPAFGWWPETDVPDLTFERGGEAPARTTPPSTPPETGRGSGTRKAFRGRKHGPASRPTPNRLWSERGRLVRVSGTAWRRIAGGGGTTGLGNLFARVGMTCGELPAAFRAALAAPAASAFYRTTNDYSPATAGSPPTPTCRTSRWLAAVGWFLQNGKPHPLKTAGRGRSARVRITDDTTFEELCRLVCGNLSTFGGGRWSTATTPGAELPEVGDAGPTCTPRPSGRRAAFVAAHGREPTRGPTPRTTGGGCDDPDRRRTRRRCCEAPGPSTGRTPCGVTG